MRIDIEAYSDIYRKYVNELYSYGLSLGYADDVCMDAIHDVFCKLVVDEKELKDIRNIKFYLFRSLKNRLIDISKRNKVTYDDMARDEFRADIALVDEQLISGEDRDKLMAKVQSLLDSLTSTQREAIYLRYIQEMEYTEIARLLNITPESARKLVHRAIDKLRQQNTGIVGFILLLSMLVKSRKS